MSKLGSWGAKRWILSHEAEAVSDVGWDRVREGLSAVGVREEDPQSPLGSL